MNACILYGIVQQAGDVLLLITPMCQHHAGNAEQMRDVRNARARTVLSRMAGHSKGGGISQAAP